MRDCVTIRVTEEDISAGDPLDSQNDATFRAMKRVVPGLVSVGVERFTYRKEDGTLDRGYLPPLAVENLEALQDGRKVDPYDFEVWEWQERHSKAN